MLDDCQRKGVEHICVATAVLIGFSGLISSWIGFGVGGFIYLLGGVFGYGDDKWYSVASSLLLGCLLLLKSMSEADFYSEVASAIGLPIFASLSVLAIYLIWSGISG